MRLSFSSKGGFENAVKWMDKVSNDSPTSLANSIAREGVNKLRANTPKDTGDTANGWVSDVKMRTNGLEIVWRNTAHPDQQVNIAKLIELGHGTKNGGYVSPRPYIKQSMDSVLESAGDKIAEEMFK